MSSPAPPGSVDCMVFLWYDFITKEKIHSPDGMQRARWASKWCLGRYTIESLASMIFITSYPYVYERHLRLFDFFKKKDDLIFILPKVWIARGGQVVVSPPEKPEFKIIKTKAFFYHSHYPIIRGLLKGWMPATPRILRHLARPGDVLLTSNEPNLLTVYLNARLARKLGLKHVFITWQNIPYTKRLKGLKLKLTLWLIKKNIALSHGVFCGTQKAYDTLEPYLDGRIKTAIIPQSGVDADLFRPDAPSDFRQKYHLENKIIFVFGAVFDERKGVFTTIEAFAQTHKEISAAHLVMIGQGKLWQEAQERVKQAGLEEHVTFIEWLPNHELAGIFASSDVLVHPSEPYRDWEEQYGWVMLQASASGLPVIATTIGSIPEAVLDQKSGILVEPKNSQALAQAMINLARHPEIREAMGKAGREYILSRLSHAAVAERMETFLREL